MKLKAGDKIPMVVLPGIDGKDFNTVKLDGRPYMISFYRFASCPFCNMRISEIVQNYDKFSDEFEHIAIFDTPLRPLTDKMEIHHAPFKILADDKNFYYKKFDIQRSVLGVLRPMVMNFPLVLKALRSGYSGSPEGNIFTMPADFLVDSHGRIQHAFYSKNQGEHIPLDEVIDFSHKSLAI